MAWSRLVPCAVGGGLAALSCAGAQAQFPAPTPPAQAAGYTLTFFDDFTNLNLAPDGVTGQHAWYRGLWWETPPSPFGATLNAKALQLTWQRGQSPADTSVTSCSQDGLRCRGFRYGYFEARMKWDVATGAWPAFWLLPVENNWGASEGGELDVFEGQGDPANAHTYYGSIHDWKLVGGVYKDIANTNGHNAAILPGVDFTQWHNYGVLWTPGAMTWYFDDAPIIDAKPYAIFDRQYYYPILAAQEGANWKYGDLTGVTAQSLKLTVDWVKVWQK